MSHSSPSLKSCCFRTTGTRPVEVTEVVAVVGVASRGQELQPAPAALLGEGKDARQRRLGDDGEVDVLADVPRGTV